jgi:thiosulfate/3-mercaptopyruvate sulfurtransferase
VVRRPLISAYELQELLELPARGAFGAPQPRPAILDVRWELGAGSGYADYKEGHIAGAAFVDLDHQLSARPGVRGRHPLPHVDRFAVDMRNAGVWNARMVVVYDAATSMAAARAWWLLRYFGHRDVAVLDGGLAAWVSAGLPLQSGLPLLKQGDFLPAPGKMPVLDARAAAHLAVEGVLLDARAPERFRGEVEPIDRVPGHIPGARNRPAAENVDSAGRFHATASLRAAFEATGVGHGVSVGAYCGSGVTAAHNVLALEISGYRSALYPGSWSEWLEDPRRPVAKGDEGPR